MGNSYDFREPLGEDLNGLYITAAQMQFFLNRPQADKKFLAGHPDFFEYFYKCAVYNIIWDLQERDPACASFFWDVEHQTVGVKFPPKGRVMQELKDRKIEYFFTKD